MPHRKAATKTPPKPARRWSHKVTEQSDALTLKPEMFKGSARAIAASLKRSAERSKRRKGTPFQSAMSMLNFYVNRAGTNLSDAQKHRMDNAKAELRKAFGREV